LYGPLVYSWARQLGVPPADAADVSQEVFRAVHGSIQSFRRDRPDDSFRGWLWTITRNKTGDHFRRLEGRPQSPGGSTARQLFEQLPDAPSEAATGADVLSAVAHRALELVRSEFEERTFRAFWRTAVDGQKAKDVAEELGMTLGAVYMAKSRVTRRLRDELADLI
jgi:RNA polymerase sigma-70 factor (ECF subfamily)